MNESRIAEIRRSKGWTQERLAAESSVTVRTIQRMEAGQDASMDTLSKIAAALQVPVGELFASVQTPQFQASVDGLEQRMAQQQEQRDSYTKGVVLIYRGVGIVLVFATVILAFSMNWGWFSWLVIPVYWGAGRLVLEAVFRLALDPKLDERYPLSKADRGILG